MKGQNIMKELLEQLNKRPDLYQQSKANIWSDPHISKGMLKAHFNKDLESATRKLDFVKKSVIWITNTFPPQQYPKLIDLGCGPGIYTELFHHHGYQVTGIDLSERSICYAKTSALKNNFNINYLLGDYTSFDLNEHYDLITLIYCDFGVFSTKSREKLLNKVYNMLNPNGALIFDVFTPLKYQGMIETKTWEISNGGFWYNDKHLILNAFYRYDDSNTYLNQHAVIAQNKVTYYNIWEHTFTLSELKSDLTQAGFKNISFFKNVIGEPYQRPSQTICVVVKK